MIKRNPFTDYYRAESVDGNSFVTLFTPVLIDRVSQLFRPGNVVLKGTPGIGKTMLLNLLKPEVRIAYAELGQEFPVPEDSKKFVSAGININTSGAWDFSQRTDDKSENRTDKVPYYFSDFINYWLVNDLILNIEKLVNSGEQLCSDAGVSKECFESGGFVKELVASDCWFGALDQVKTLEDFKSEVKSRLLTYKKYLNFNISSIPTEIDETKTEIGKPINVMVDVLKKAGCIEKDSNVFIHIDQYEDLFHIEDDVDIYNESYREMINKALADRSSLVSYRIGTRSYAWNDNNLKIFGSSATLESGRTHSLLDMNQELRRLEDPSSWIFPGLMEKVFLRRLKGAGYEISIPNGKELMLEVFGVSLDADEKAKYYAGSNPKRALRIDKGWPDDFTDFLNRVNDENPLDAKLVEAWVRQKGKDKSAYISNFIDVENMPWKNKPYWRKERVAHGLKQISSRCGQREIWSGYNDILILSGSNISTFLKICKYIWDELIEEDASIFKDDSLFQIDSRIQNIGIHKASAHSVRQIASEYNGENRSAFILTSSSFLEKRLYNDIAMSYPGNTGFSLKSEDISLDVELDALLADLVGFGDVVESDHTTKSADRKSRKKYYFRPILCPFLKIPPSKTKEPYYASLEEVKGWMNMSEGRVRNTFDDSNDDFQGEFKF